MRLYLWLFYLKLIDLGNLIVVLNIVMMILILIGQTLSLRLNWLIHHLLSLGKIWILFNGIVESIKKIIWISEIWWLLSWLLLCTSIISLSVWVEIDFILIIILVILVIKIWIVLRLVKILGLLCVILYWMLILRLRFIVVVLILILLYRLILLHGVWVSDLGLIIHLIRLLLMI